MSALRQYLSPLGHLVREVVGWIAVDGEESDARVTLAPEEEFAIGPLNPPLPKRLTFRGSELTTNDYRLNEKSRDMAFLGIQMFLLLDPRTYLRIDELLDVEQDVVEEGTMFYASYPVSPAFAELGVTELEVGWLSSLLGQRHESALLFSTDGELELSVEDPLPGHGSVTARYRLAPRG